MRMGWFYGGVISFFRFTVIFRGDVEASTYFEGFHAVTIGLARIENKAWQTKQSQRARFSLSKVY